MASMLIHQLFEQQVTQTPDKVAVRHGQQALSFNTLNKTANKIAHYLIKKGIKADQLVGIRMNRSINMIAALLGILKSGGAYLPLDPKYPLSLLKRITEDAKPKIVLIDKDQFSLPIAGEEILDLEKATDEISKEADSNPDVPIKNTNLAYCIYTSGTTGRPKGVLVEHHSVVSFLQSAVKDYQITPLDHLLQFASLNFDTSVEEIYPPLISGAELVLRQEDMTDSMQRFLRDCEEYQLSILDLPTAFWHELVIFLDESREALPKSVRLVIIGGERVSPDILEIWHRMENLGVRLENTYGLTECTCVSTRTVLKAEERMSYPNREVTIGFPIENVKTFILDDSQKAVADGLIGELYIGGGNLARGYLNLPELTLERFMADPFSEKKARMYKTGDIVMKRSDGSLEYLGRSDDQIKIRGFRIEPGEVEAAILENRKIKQAVVIKKTDQSGSDNLVAYLMVKKGVEVSRETIWKDLGDKLPVHMIPVHLVFLETFPLSPNNKIDKNLLPEPNWAEVSVAEYVAPTTETEKMLMEIWEEILGRKGFGIEDDFFEIGGNSILAARVATTLERRTNQSIPLAVFIEAQTIRALAKKLEDTVGQNALQILVPMQALSGGKPPLFLAHAMWGDILSYRRLVNYLDDEDQPVYGFRAPGFDGVTPPMTNLKAMAAQYVTEVKKIQPSGPYYLGGYSFGGTISYEMAQQLMAGGEKVALLAMIDTVIMESVPPKLMPTRVELLFDRIVKSFLVAGKLITLPSDRKTKRIKETVETVKDWIAAKVSGKKFIPPGFIEGEERKTNMPAYYGKVYEANYEALRGYTAAPYPGTVTLFNARERQWSDLVNPVPFWKKIALGGVESITCSGKHYSILDEPYVQDLAVQFKRVLQEKQSRN